MLSNSEIESIKKELTDSKHPLFLFHDDPDGLTSFLLLYRMIKRGSGMMVKSIPRIDDRFIEKAKDPAYDKVFILDIAMVEQSFIDEVKKPVIWIDHHQPLKRENVRYFNPRSSNIKDNFPASYICYSVSKNKDDLWIAMTGIVGDWMVPEFADEFAKQYPDLFDSGIKKPDVAMYETKLGTMIKLFTFVLKGPTEDAMKCVKILTRMTDPYEILEQKTPAGKYLYRKFEKINSGYVKVLDAAKKIANKEKFLIYIYKGKQSFSGEVANELLHDYPDKVIVVGREISDEVRMSLRGSGKNLILPRLKTALTDVEGYGGGHEYACGSAVKQKDFDRFIDNFKKLFV